MRIQTVITGYPWGFPGHGCGGGVTPTHSQNAKKHFSEVKCKAKRSRHGTEQAKSTVPSKSLVAQGIARVMEQLEQFFPIIFSGVSVETITTFIVPLFRSK